MTLFAQWLFYFSSSLTSIVLGSISITGPCLTSRCVVFDGESVSGSAPAGAVYQVAEPRADEGDQSELD